MHLEFIRDPARQMPTVPNAAQITSLAVWYCNFESLASLTYFTNLKALKIAGYPDESLEPLESMKGLVWLSILHMPKVSDLEPLTKLHALTSLELQTLPSWDSSRKRQVVKALEPLTRIPKLAHLSLFGVIPSSKSLAALEGCKNLSAVRVSGYPAAEVKRFYAASGVENAFMPKFPEA